MVKLRIPFMMGAAFVVLTSVNWSPSDVGISEIEPAVINSHGTTVTAVLDEEIPDGKNVLWCATFQMAWDSAGKRFGKPIRLQPASKLADSLNKEAFNLNGVDADSVFVTEGVVGEDVLARIDARVRAKFRQASKLALELKKSSLPDDLVFFAMLHKQLKFENPFGKLGNWKLGSRSVPWFGFTPEQQNTGKLLQQVRVHHYAAKNNFVIELITNGIGDQLLLAKLPDAPKNPGDLSRAVIGRLRNDAPAAAAKDLLAVPNVIVEESAEFTQLENRKVVSNGLPLKKALQTIDFRMDEKGVKLDSEAAISFGCSVVPHITPRLMVLDPPFALIMKRKNAAQPYFVAWFANADALRGK